MTLPAPQGRMLRRGWRVLRRLVAAQRKTFFIAVGGAAVYALATVASSYVLGRVTDRVIIPRFEQGDVPTGTIVAAIAAVIAVGIVKCAGIITRRVAATMTTARVAAGLRSDVVRRYQEVPFEYHQRKPTGELIAHAGADVDAATDIMNPLPFSTGVIVIIVTSSVWLLLTDLWLALVGFVVFPALAAVNLVYQRRVERPAEVAQERIGRVSAVAHESFDGALVVKALGAEEIEEERFRAVSADLRDAKIQVATLRASFEAVLDAMPSIAIVVLVLVGAWRIESGDITTGTLVSFANLFTIIVFPLRLIGYVLGDLPRSVAGFDRVQEVLAEPTDLRHGNRPPAMGSRPPRAHDRGAALSVENLTFSYEPGRPAIEGVSFSVAPGRTVAIVGPTGSGKSTLLLVVAGLLRPDGGAVRLDGIDVANLDVAQLREWVAMAFQEPFLFGQPVAENILLGIDRAALEPAAELAAASRFVAHLPSGFDTVVGERGATLSGGQRQRVALARALARRPRLLLLDDATSSVDPTTEAAILAGLARRLDATTTVVVANRPSTVALADEVIFLEEGRLVAHGRHADLLAAVPAYERLVRAYELDRAERAPA